MKSNPVGWFEIYVQDMNRAKTFYEAVLNVSLSELPMGDANMLMYVFPSDMNSYGTAGALVQMQGVNSGGNSVQVYFSCADCAIEAGRVVTNGGQLTQEKMSIGEYGYFAMAQDTEGNIFGLHSMQ